MASAMMVPVPVPAGSVADSRMSVMRMAMIPDSAGSTHDYHALHSIAHNIKTCMFTAQLVAGVIGPAG